MFVQSLVVAHHDEEEEEEELLLSLSNIPSKTLSSNFIRRKQINAFSFREIPKSTLLSYWKNKSWNGKSGIFLLLLEEIMETRKQEEIGSNWT